MLCLDIASTVRTSAEGGTYTVCDGSVITVIYIDGVLSIVKTRISFNPQWWHKTNTGFIGLTTDNKIAQWPENDTENTTPGSGVLPSSFVFAGNNFYIHKAMGWVVKSFEDIAQAETIDNMYRNVTITPREGLPRFFGRPSSSFLVVDGCDPVKVSLHQAEGSENRFLKVGDISAKSENSHLVSQPYQKYLQNVLHIPLSLHGDIYYDVDKDRHICIGENRECPGTQDIYSLNDACVWSRHTIGLGGEYNLLLLDTSHLAFCAFCSHEGWRLVKIAQMKDEEGT